MKTAQRNHIAPSRSGYSPFFKKGNNKSFFNSATIQTKLTVNEPGDIYEKEADAMADKVVQRMTDKSFAGDENNNGHFFNKAKSFVQRKCAACEHEDTLQEKEDGPKEDELQGKLQRKPIFESNAEHPDENNVQRKCDSCEKEEKLQKKESSSSPSSASPDIESTLNTTRGTGNPMPVALRKQMESSFGSDFSGVKIHNDSTSVQMNESLNAQAFTRGSDIYFNSGKYNTDSNSGKHLLAHELTHVVQQGGTVHTKAIQRRWSWGGAGAGALLGGAAGAAIGGFAGGAPGALIGAGAGALIGGVAGGLLGGSSSSKTVTINTTTLTGATNNTDRDIRTSNNIFSRNNCNVRLAKGNTSSLNSTQTSTILGSDNLLEEPSGDTASTEEQSLTAINRNAGRLTAYYVPGFNPSKRGTSLQQASHGVPDSLLMSAGAAIDTYSHELCHILTRGRGHSTDPDNLMASGDIRNVGVDNLTADQCNSVSTTTNYPQ